MNVQTRHQRSRTRRGLGRSAAVAAARQPQADPASPAGARERAAGGPQDQARYQCTCGCVFEASVSTTVSCPRCGGEQAW